MEQIKHKYNVYLVGRGHGCYAAEVKRTFMGETWAVSEKKAASNIHYRIRQNGEKFPEDYSDRDKVKKAVASLVRAGFDYSDIIKAIDAKTDDF